MPEAPRSDSLLDQLDTLQEHVLAELDALDERILSLIRECTQPLRVAPETLPHKAADAA